MSKWEVVKNNYKRKINQIMTFSKWFMSIEKNSMSISIQITTACCLTVNSILFLLFRRDGELHVQWWRVIQIAVSVCDQRVQRGRVFGLFLRWRRPDRLFRINNVRFPKYTWHKIWHLTKCEFKNQAWNITKSCIS